MLCIAAVNAEWITVCFRHWSPVARTVSFYWYNCRRWQNAASQHCSYWW